MDNKILIVTLPTSVSGGNIGNRLQNYALVRVVNELGYAAVNAQYHQKKKVSTIVKKQMKKLLSVVGIEKYRVKYSYTCLEEKRTHLILEYEKKLVVKSIDLSDGNIHHFDHRDYHCAITGSDQVWHNWHSRRNELSYFYLRFMPKNKRVSYAPSFGFKNFPVEDKEEHIKGLKGMAALSCREKDGCELIKRETGRDAEWVLDPTLLLEKEDWNRIARKPSYDIPEHFLLLYFLGNITKEYQTKIDEVAERFQLRTINILSPLDSPDYYLTTPDEFVYLVSQADFICTDSFHATVFSIIYSKNFITFKRHQEGFMDMFGRIGDLLEETGLTEHEYNKEFTPKNNVAGAFEKLGKQRKASVNYLKEAIEKS